jgi:hypothetical protein
MAPTANLILTGTPPFRGSPAATAASVQAHDGRADEEGKSYGGYPG